MSSASPEPAVAPLSRADRKIQIQQNIVEAALALTEQHGVEGWTMQMLAEELGWSTGAAYRHLTGKEALLEQVAIEVLKQVELPDAAEGDWEARFRALAWSTWRQLSTQRWVANYVLTHPQTGAFANRFFGAPLVQIFGEAGYDLGTVSLPIGLFAAFMFGSLCGFEAEGAARSGSDSSRASAKRRGSRRMKGHTAEEHFEWGLNALVEAIITGRTSAGSRPG